MADFRHPRLSKPELAREVRQYRPALAEVGWLLGISGRWAGELTRTGELPIGATLPELVTAWIRYQAKHPRPGRSNG